MKILHCCLAAFYIDDYGYQENILPKIHKKQGHQVEILASTETYLNNSELGYIKPKSYQTKDNIPIRRIPYIGLLPHFVAKKLRIYTGIKEVLQRFKPDILFLHDCQFLSITQIVKYKKENKNVKIYIDSHTDFINSGKNWLSKNILHGYVYRWCAKKIEPYANKFYGTLPLRNNFLKEVYNISEKKIDLLVLGVDDTNIDYENKIDIRNQIRSELSVDEDVFLIITGGKIDPRKNIINLMSAIKQINNDKIKLIVFGSINKDLKEDFSKLSKNNNIISISWINSENIYKYFFASDLAFFPGTHSVLWEEAVGLGMPCVFRKWDGIQHIDLGGNCLFINHGNIEEIQKIILNLYNDKQKILDMKENAILKGIPYFSYSKIAKRAIEL